MDVSVIIKHCGYVSFNGKSRHCCYPNVEPLVFVLFGSRWMAWLAWAHCLLTTLSGLSALIDSDIEHVTCDSHDTLSFCMSYVCVISVIFNCNCIMHLCDFLVHCTELKCTFSWVQMLLKCLFVCFNIVDIAANLLWILFVDIKQEWRIAEDWRREAGLGERWFIGTKAM